ncbi:HAD-IIB family hydrolase [Pseudoruegeria sp. SK021]|uniref:HAD-IIB family hydrolase n=1 Tax=Pseudoruegeria sp. SK021 TaxID=1933035 RepID=UPI000A21EC89|nr:HAD-IIB family hydrolase [Pseudoruegeria sp. SK021]OSP56615.1 alpha,alpha-trehalose-phosphate synthase [Pseudoruegeria sp. SK021]
MTIFQPETPTPSLSTRQFTLATDLDGTFLGGTDADRQRLYRWIEAHRSSVGLIFVTGRDPDFITELVRSGQAPRPDYVVGDVGTTIAQVAEDATVHPIPALEADISQRWNDSAEAVRAALADHPGLTLQPTAFRHRVSYDLHPDHFDRKSIETVRDMDLDHLISDNRYFDVLPRGVSKGPSLLRLLAHLEVPQAQVLAAGDTMNDLTMLICGVPAVAVGGSEAPLLDAVRDHATVYKAKDIGAAGIIEAIAALSLHPQIEDAQHEV